MDSVTSISSSQKTEQYSSQDESSRDVSPVKSKQILESPDRSISNTSHSTSHVSPKKKARVVSFTPALGRGSVNSKDVIKTPNSLLHNKNKIKNGTTKSVVLFNPSTILPAEIENIKYNAALLSFIQKELNEVFPGSTGKSLFQKCIDDYVITQSFNRAILLIIKRTDVSNGNPLMGNQIKALVVKYGNMERQTRSQGVAQTLTPISGTMMEL